jgi:hypothetical protein
MEQINLGNDMVVTYVGVPTKEQVLRDFGYIPERWAASIEENSEENEE